MRRRPTPHLVRKLRARDNRPKVGGSRDYHWLHCAGRAKRKRVRYFTLALREMVRGMNKLREQIAHIPAFDDQVDALRFALGGLPILQPHADTPTPTHEHV